MTVATIETINANVWFKLADAPLVIERFAGLTTFTPTLGWWSTEWSAEYGETPVHVTLSCADSVFAEFTPDDAPAWIPRPPDGWNAGVLAAVASAAQR